VRHRFGISQAFASINNSKYNKIVHRFHDRQSSYLFAHHPDLNVADPEITARFFIGNMVHYAIVQEILNGRDILPMERDRFVDGSIDLIVSGN
jgi:hypothetical protein